MVHSDPEGEGDQRRERKSLRPVEKEHSLWVCDPQGNMNSLGTKQRACQSKASYQILHREKSISSGGPGPCALAPCCGQLCQSVCPNVCLLAPLSPYCSGLVPIPTEACATASKIDFLHWVDQQQNISPIDRQGPFCPP